jgi:hypothetical protein
MCPAAQISTICAENLRAGFATSATRVGVSTFKIRQQTGQASDAMLSRYVREGTSSSGTPLAFSSNHANDSSACGIWATTCAESGVSIAQ